MDFYTLIKILIVLFVAISVFYTITYFDWKHNIFPFSKEEEGEYRKLLCNKIGLDYFAFQFDSIELLEKQINPRHWDIKELRKSIKNNQELRIFGIVIDEEDITLRKLFLYKRERYSKASRYPSDPVYKKTSLMIFCFIPMISWKKIDYDY